ncbi:hypothetical protein HRI_004023300 [Hibiscus trionum]|uniref:Organ-specific protein S2 n=1 Tax=Hibiscus trionum TaxID=183268 RepID=A0A9W7IXA7_HIBTR|nr:hypothetical protein HRI_004023300 [Hibiscus trionum]
MKSFLPFFAFLSLLLFADTTAAARKDAWRAVMKDQPMPEALKELVRVEAASEEKIKCTTPASIELKEEKIIVEDFERPIRPKGDRKKSTLSDDSEPRPSVTAYIDDRKSSSFAEDFEPRPSVTAYGGDDAGLKGKKKSFTSNFEPEPNISVYQD